MVGKRTFWSVHRISFSSIQVCRVVDKCRLRESPDLRSRRLDEERWLQRNYEKWVWSYGRNRDSIDGRAQRIGIEESGLSICFAGRMDWWKTGRNLTDGLMGLNLRPISFRALHASWVTLMLSKGVEPVKVMKMGGWLSLKTLEKHYIRLSNVDIRGMTDKNHDPSENSETVLRLNRDGK